MHRWIHNLCSHVLSDANTFKHNTQGNKLQFAVVARIGAARQIGHRPDVFVLPFLSMLLVGAGPPSVFPRPLPSLDLSDFSAARCSRYQCIATFRTSAACARPRSACRGGSSGDDGDDGRVAVSVLAVSGASIVATSQAPRFGALLETRRGRQRSMEQRLRRSAPRDRLPSQGRRFGRRGGFGSSGSVMARTSAKGMRSTGASGSKSAGRVLAPSRCCNSAGSGPPLADETSAFRPARGFCGGEPPVYQWRLRASSSLGEICFRSARG